MNLFQVAIQLEMGGPIVTYVEFAGTAQQLGQEYNSLLLINQFVVMRCKRKPNNATLVKCMNVSLIDITFMGVVEQPVVTPPGSAPPPPAVEGDNKNVN